MRVVAAMSGGVDSAVAAARMLDAGHEVVGVHLALSSSAATLRESARGCCTLEDAGDARRVADRLGHDLRYSVDITKIREELGYEPQVPFEQGLADVVQWYRDNRAWWEPLKERAALQ